LGSDRVAARWSANSSFTIDLNITDGQAHRVALYNLDWDGNNRSQRIDVSDWATDALLDTQSINSFNGGQYLVWDIRGRVKISIVRTGAKTAVVSGLYFGAAANPTPTPTPSPSPSPTPNGNAAPSVAIVSPSGGSVFGSGSNVSINANAADTDGAVTKVDFFRNGTLVGTSTTSPYNFVWSNVPNGNYSMTARATDNLGATTTSSPVAVYVKNSPTSVNKARDRGNNLINELSTNSAFGGVDSITASALNSELLSLVGEIQTAYSDFLAEQNTFASANWINRQLQAALYLSKADAALAFRVGPSSTVRSNLLRLVAHLSVSEELLLYNSVSAATQAQAAAANARLDITVGPATAGYSLASSTGQLAPVSLGSIFGDSATSPLSTQTLFAPVGSDGTLPYELAGVTVTLGGKAVPVTFVGSGRVSFYVSPDVPTGTVEVIVTSPDGYVSRGQTTISANATWLFTANENDGGSAMALNSAHQLASTFNLLTQENFGSDKRTRVGFYVTGISGSAINSNPANDIYVGGVVRQNFAESVIVQARLSSGTTINLPVEFAGRQGVLPGLDQVNVILPSQLSGAGLVQLTITVGGQRSNRGSIVVQ
jgi:uncharacterized protein (TIGR03437 family)